MDSGTPERPIYEVLPEPGRTNIYMIGVNEGWRSSIVCTGLYDWAARWLVEQLQGKPYAPGLRPGDQS